MKLKWLLGLAAGVLASAVFAANVLATPPTSTLKQQIVATASFGPLHLDAVQFPPFWRARLRTRGVSDVYVVDTLFSPGDSTGWHSHPGPSLVIVKTGTVTNYEAVGSSCTSHTYTAGQGFVDAGGSDEHMVRDDTSAPAELIAVQILPGGSQRRVDEPAPANCPSQASQDPHTKNR
jgi:quercetin dioxygenase-like cupin family protein